MKAYNKDREKKRRRRAVQEQFPKQQRTCADSLPKQIIKIDKNTEVYAPEAVPELKIRSRYE